jgi:hypothetical protein
MMTTTQLSAMRSALEALLHAVPRTSGQAMEQADAIVACRSALVEPEPAQTPQRREPLTDEQRKELWRSSDFRGNGGQADWFDAGIRAAELAHGIGAIMPITPSDILPRRPIPEIATGPATKE